MVRFAAGEECKAVRDLAERFSIQFPKEGDFDALTITSVFVPAATRATLTFEARKGYMIHIPKIIVADVPNTEYKFVVAGQEFSGDNEAIFRVPQKSSIHTGPVTIVIDNLNAVGFTYAIRIEAWARSLGT